LINYPLDKIKPGHTSCAQLSKVQIMEETLVAHFPGVFTSIRFFSVQKKTTVAINFEASLNAAIKNPFENGKISRSEGLIAEDMVVTTKRNRLDNIIENLQKKYIGGRAILKGLKKSKQKRSLENSTNPNIKSCKKRKIMDQYDFDDGFIDDSEIVDDIEKQILMKKKKTRLPGYFVSKGSLLVEPDLSEGSLSPSSSDEDAPSVITDEEKGILASSKVEGRCADELSSCGESAKCDDQNSSISRTVSRSASSASESEGDTLSKDEVLPDVEDSENSQSGESSRRDINLQAGSGDPRNPSVVGLPPLSKSDNVQEMLRLPALTRSPLGPLLTPLVSNQIPVADSLEEFDSPPIFRYEDFEAIQ